MRVILCYIMSHSDNKSTDGATIPSLWTRVKDHTTQFLSTPTGKVVVGTTLVMATAALLAAWKSKSNSKSNSQCSLKTDTVSVPSIASDVKRTIASDVKPSIASDVKPSIDRPFNLDDVHVK